MATEPHTLWVLSDRTHDNKYTVAVTYGPDFTHPMDPHTATEYATRAYTAAAQAEYDAAVNRQQKKLLQDTDGMPPELLAAHIVLGLREHRPPPTGNHPIDFHPTVSAHTGQPPIGRNTNGHVKRRRRRPIR